MGGGCSACRKCFEIGTDSVYRLLFIIIFGALGLYSLVFTDDYMSTLGVNCIDSSMGLSELQTIGAVYLVPSVYCIFAWAMECAGKDQYIMDFYKFASYLTGAIVMARVASVAKIDFDLQVLIRAGVELILFLWSVTRVWCYEKRSCCRKGYEPPPEAEATELSMVGLSGMQEEEVPQEAPVPGQSTEFAPLTYFNDVLTNGFTFNSNVKG